MGVRVMSSLIYAAAVIAGLFVFIVLADPLIKMVLRWA